MEKMFKNANRIYKKKNKYYQLNKKKACKRYYLKNQKAIQLRNKQIMRKLRRKTKEEKAQ